jgi:hypothetical protein
MLGFAAALALMAPQMSVAKDGRNAALIAGALLGAAAAGASSRDHRHEHYEPYYEDDFQPRRQQRYQAEYHPYPGVTCYPGQRTCYKANGNYSPTITHRVYGY